MEHYFLSIEQFDELLKQWNGQQIKVEKIELDDKDEIEMKLDTISYEKNPNFIDDYRSMYSLQLNGDGHIQTENAEQPLPDSSYVIPIEDSSLYEYDGNQFLISTDRGVYKIQLMQG